MGCTHDCSSCGESCNSKKPENLIEKLNQYSSVKKVIGVVSGKGGVGKSLVTSTLAVTMNRKGYKTAILDADITGPSIPKSFGIHEKAKGNDDGIFPAKTKDGIDIMSINLLLPDETSPVVWRGPVIAGATGYYVYSKTGNSGYKLVADVKGGNVKSYTDKNVVSGKKYTYTVKAYIICPAGYISGGYNKKGVTITVK